MADCYVNANSWMARYYVYIYGFEVPLYPLLIFSFAEKKGVKVEENEAE